MAWIAPKPPISPRATWPSAIFTRWKENETARAKMAVIRPCTPTYSGAKNSTTLTANDLPNIVTIESRHKRLADLMYAPDQMIMVQEPLRGLIEEFEPGVHQFWPMTVACEQPVDEPPQPCFGLRIRQAHRSIIFEQSELEIHSLGSDDPNTTEVPFKNPKELFDRWKISIRKKHVEASHLWCDFLTANHLMMSDELYTAIQARNLKIWRCFRVKEV